ncbi:MAG TPA: hypothetical protein VFA07_01550 [Chthonomonadaceae bacterium]|nr:hypothetical protein [Chthonomonadaceae bacterium]
MATTPNVADLKLLFLSEEEALALLDLCLLSCAEIDATKERALLKLAHLVQEHNMPSATAPGSARRSRRSALPLSRLAGIKPVPIEHGREEHDREERAAVRIQADEDGREVIPVGRRRDWRIDQTWRAAEGRDHVLD